MKHLTTVAIIAATILTIASCNKTNGGGDASDASDTIGVDVSYIKLIPDTGIIADLTLNEVSGPVKSIVTYDDSGSDTVFFDRNGYCIGPILELHGEFADAPTWVEFARPGVTEITAGDKKIRAERDERGRIVNFNFNDEVEYTYTWRGPLLASCKTTEYLGGIITDSDGRYTYDDNGYATSYTAVTTYGRRGGNAHEYIEKYSSYRYDEHHNWIERTTTLPDETFTVRRTIEYY